ncbi:MAG: hypothetical protein ACRD4Q_05515 [Candidatus Acidiferrales bacterium]
MKNPKADWPYARNAVTVELMATKQADSPSRLPAAGNPHNPVQSDTTRESDLGIRALQAGRRVMARYPNAMRGLTT